MRFYMLLDDFAVKNKRFQRVFVSEILLKIAYNAKKILYRTRKFWTSQIAETYIGFEYYGPHGC